jgi:hypothetical protein
MDPAEPRGPEAQAAKPQRRRRGRRRISHLFQVQLSDTSLSEEQVERLASAIREATTRELLRMDFRIDELAPLRDERGGCCSCGSWPG